MKAMALQPEHRYGRPVEIADDIERYLADEAVQAFREPLTARMRRWVRKHQTLATTSAAVVLLSTAGHTPGHQSALISLPQTGRALLVGDVGDWMANFEHEILPGEASDDVAALESIRKINRIRRDQDALMFVCHDPDLIQKQKLAPDFYT